MNPLITTFASSYAATLNHLYGVLECLIKTDIHLYNIRTSMSATLLEDVGSSVQPFLDLHEERHHKLGLAGAEVNVSKAVIQEVRPSSLSRLLAFANFTLISSWKFFLLSKLPFTMTKAHLVRITPDI